MTSSLIKDIKKLFRYKSKTRRDTLIDQYHRLYMVRMFFVAAFVTGFNW